MALLNKKGGKWLSNALEAEIEWQLASPSGTVEECKAWLKHGKFD